MGGSLALEHSLGKGHRTKTWSRVSWPLEYSTFCGVYVGFMEERGSREEGTQKDGDREEGAKSMGSFNGGLRPSLVPLPGLTSSFTVLSPPLQPPTCLGHSNLVVLHSGLSELQDRLIQAWAPLRTSQIWAVKTDRCEYWALLRPSVS